MGFQDELSYQHPVTGEWAHDVRNPLREAECTYVRPAWRACPPSTDRSFRILEIGFGRGLNTAMSLKLLHEAGHTGPVSCFGMEPHPELLIPWPNSVTALAPFAPWWGKPYPSEWALSEVQATGAISSLPALTALEKEDGPWDWVFLDLFSPGKHPADWEPGLFQLLRSKMRPTSVITTYCCARKIRERLSSAGFLPEVLKATHHRDTLLARVSI